MKLLFRQVRVTHHQLPGVPETLALFRFLTASVFLVGYAVIFKMRMPAREDIPLILGNGLIGFTLYNWFLNMGSRTLAAGVTSFLISTAPLFTTVFSRLFLKEKMNFREWTGIIIGFTGVGVITLSEKSNGIINIGVAWIFIATVLISLYNITVKRLLRKYRPVEATVYSIWAGTFFMLVSIGDLIKQFAAAPLITNFIIIYLGVFPAAVGYILWSYALSKTEKTCNVALWH